MRVVKFTFNGFAENTYLLYDETGEAVIVDPGCYSPEEERELLKFIDEYDLKLVQLFNTHFHLDHIFGNRLMFDEFGLKPTGHKADLPTLQMAGISADMYGFSGYKPSPAPGKFIDEGDRLKFGNTELDILFTPGHAPGHVTAVNHREKCVIGGDVLFDGSIGRADLPGGDFDTLADSIRTKLYTLPDDYTVYCGHGPETSIGKEKRSNPFVRS